MSESIQLYLNSANADRYNTSGYTTDCDFNLPVIEIPDGFHIYLSVQHALIPFSFYNINSSNNILNYTINSSSYSLVIPNGNYNVNQLISQILSLMIAGFSISYSSITNLMTFSHTSYDFTFNSTSTCFGILGFATTISSTSKSLVSVYAVNVSPIKSINVVSNLITYNINKAMKNNNSILCSISVNKPPYSNIEYSNPNNYRSNLFINQISVLKIKLVDDNGNLINLNGCNFSMTIQLDVEKFTD